jgi:putative transposase
MEFMDQSEPQTLYRTWPHAPSHLFVPGGSYIITAATYQKKLVFRGSPRLSFLQSVIFGQTLQFGWKLEAWAILANHYHLIAQGPENAKNLPEMLQAIHSLAAEQANEWDSTPGRKVWWQYWDTCLTYPWSYYARLNYVHHNPEHHRLVEDAANYPWCSMGWFTLRAASAYRRKILSFAYDKIAIPDDF